MSIYSKFLNFIKKYDLIKENDKILLGVSGGPDSLTMLDLFANLKDDFYLDISIFHLNHCFREAAADEAAFVSNVANNYGFSCYIEKVDVPQIIEKEKLSAEQAARKVRFKLMKKWADRLDIDKIALAHNKNDQVETVFLHLIRGSGVSGLRGIDPLGKYDGYVIIHPLLNIYRYEIEKYCREKGLNPRRDPSNEKTIYTRNKIRHELIPYIETEINEGIKSVIYRMADIVRVEDDFLEKVVENKFEEVKIKESKSRIVLDRDRLQKIHTALIRRLLRKVVYKLKEESADIYFQHLKDLQWLIFVGETGKKLSLPGEIIAKRSYNKIIFSRGEIEVSKKMIKFEGKLAINDRIILPDDSSISFHIKRKGYDWQSNNNSSNCFFDPDYVELPLFVRTRKPGDRFKPLGMKGFKKLKDFFIDEKIPAKRRDEIPLVLDNRERIIWVAGMRMDDRMKITDKTVEIGELKYWRKDDLNE